VPERTNGTVSKTVEGSAFRGFESLPLRQLCLFASLRRTDRFAIVRTVRRRVVGLGLAAVLSVAACGSGGSKDASSTARSEPTRPDAPSGTRAPSWWTAASPSPAQPDPTSGAPASASPPGEGPQAGTAIDDGPADVFPRSELPDPCSLLDPWAVGDFLVDRGNGPTPLEEGEACGWTDRNDERRVAIALLPAEPRRWRDDSAEGTQVEDTGGPTYWFHRHPVSVSSTLVVELPDVDLVVEVSSLDDADERTLQRAALAYARAAGEKL
jgi:hypothetical protein